MTHAITNIAKLPDDIKKDIFVDSAQLDYREIGKKYGYSALYANHATLTVKLSNIMKEVKTDPERFGLTADDVERIEAAKKLRIRGRLKPLQGMSTRGSVLPKSEKQTRNLEKVELEIKDNLLHARAKALALLHKKLDRVAEGDNIDGIRIVELTTAFGTIFDKTQIVSGEATENVAIMAKIDSNMKPEDALKAILDMREENQVNKNSKK